MVGSKVGELDNELQKLIDAGADLLNNLCDDDTALFDFSLQYQTWYTKGLEVVRILLPDRLEEFRGYYRVDKRKQVDVESYGIADYLQGYSITRMGQRAFETQPVAASKFLQQILIIRSIRDKLGSSIANIRSVLQADLFDSELDAASELAKNGHLRAAGALAGVTLERHLGAVLDAHNVTTRKKSPSISDLNDLLKKADVLDVPTWRHIQRLADLRNLCAHAREREPTEEEIGDLIAGVDKCIKSIF